MLPYGEGRAGVGEAALGLISKRGGGGERETQGREISFVGIGRGEIPKRAARLASRSAPSARRLERPPRSHAVSVFTCRPFLRLRDTLFVCVRALFGFGKKEENGHRKGSLSVCVCVRCRMKENGHRKVSLCVCVVGWRSKNSPAG